MRSRRWRSSTLKEVSKLFFTAVCVCACCAAQAQTVRYKANNTYNLNLTTSWVGGNRPTASQVAGWNSTVTGPNSVNLGANLSYLGIRVENPGGAVTIGGAYSLSTDMLGIDMSAATANLTLNNASLALKDYVSTAWTVKSGRTLTVTPTVFTRGVRAALRLPGAGTVASGTIANDANGIVGPWASIGTATAMRYVTVSGGNLVGYTGGTAAPTAAAVTDTTGSVNYDVAAGGSTAANAKFNTLRYTGAAGGNIVGAFTANGILNSGAGTLLFNSGASANVITIGPTRELVLTTPDATRTTAIYCPIADHASGASGVTATGGGTVNLRGNNTYSGVTVVTSGTLLPYHSNALGATNGHTVIYSTGRTDGGRLWLPGVTLAEPITLAGPGDGVASGWQNAIGCVANTTNTLTGTLTLTGTTGYRIGTDSTFSELRLGPIRRSTASAGGLYLFPATKSTVIANGLIDLNGGWLTVQTPGYTPGTVVLNAASNDVGTVRIHRNSILKLTAPDALVNSTSLVIGNTTGNTTVNASGGSKEDVGTVDLTGVSQTIDILTGAPNGGAAPNGATASDSRKVTNTSDGAATLTVGIRNGSGAFDGVIENGPGGGAVALTKVGTGTLTLTGNRDNTYTGVTAVANGLLYLNKTNGYTAVSGDIVIGAGTSSTGTLQIAQNNQIADTATVTMTAATSKWLLSGKSETVANLDMQNASPFVNAGFVSGGNGQLTVTGTFTHTLGNVTLNSAAPGASITANTLVNRGGSWTFGVGGGAKSLTIGSGGLTIGGGSTILVDANASNANVISLAGNITSEATAAPNTISGAGRLLLNGPRVFDVADGAAPVDLTVSAIIANGTGAGSITKTGPGTLSLSGTGANTYTGITAVDGGKLSLNKTAGTNAVAGNIVIGAGLLEHGQTNQIADTATVTLTTATSKWNLNGKSETVANVDIQNADPGVNAGFSTGAKGKLTVTGTFTHTLGGITLNDSGSAATTSTITANTLVNRGGTWTFGTSSGTQSLKIGAGGLTIGGGSTIAVDAAADSTNFISLAGNITSEATAAPNTISGAGRLLLNGPRVFDVADGAAPVDLSVSAIIANGTGASSITKTGPGTLSLTGANTFTGGITVNEGTLAVSSLTPLPGWDTLGLYKIGNNGMLAVDNSIADGDVATLLERVDFQDGAYICFDTTSGNRTYSRVIGDTASGALGVYKVGLNTLSLTGNNTYNGNTFVTRGYLYFNHDNALGTATGSTFIYATGHNTNGGMVAIGPNVKTLEPFTLTGPGDGNGGYSPALYSSGGGTRSVEGAITLASQGKRFRINTENGNLTLNGPVGLASGVTGCSLTSQTQAGTELFVSNTVDCGTGDYWVLGVNSQGVVKFCSTGNNWAYLWIQQGGTARLGVDDALPTDKVVRFGGYNSTATGALDLGGFDQAVGGLQTYSLPATVRNNVISNSAPSSFSTLTVNQAAGVSNAFPGRIVGAVHLVKAGAANSQLLLTDVNELSGTATVAGGKLVLDGAAGSLGASCTNVVVNAGTLTVRNSSAIANRAVLRVAAGGGAKVELAAGVNEAVGYLLLDGEIQSTGTYGSTSSAATHKNDAFFSGTGVLTVLYDTVTLMGFDYYVSNEGHDENDGLTMTSAWATLERVNAAQLNPGDRVLFKRGDVWRGSLKPKSGSAGNPVSYTVYGTGPKPSFLGSKPMNNAADWTEVSPNIWQAGEQPIPHGPNLLPNPSFDSGTASWTLWSGNGASASMARDTVNYHSSPAGLRLNCLTNGSGDTDIQLVTRRLTFTNGVTYTLTFAARCTSAFTLTKVMMQKDGPPYTSYTSSSTGPFAIGTNWKTYVVNFTANQTVDDVRLSFFPGGSIPDGATLYLDSLTLRECSDADLLDKDVGNIILDGGLTCGVKVWQEAELDRQNEFWFDQAYKVVRMYSTNNPALLYNSIECALRRDIIEETGARSVVYDGLALSNGGAHGIGGGNTANIIVRNCDISFMGGGNQYGGTNTVRYGNGIEFWANASNNLVEGCLLREIYDAALTAQSNVTSTRQVNITFRNNLISKSEYSFEFWNNPASSFSSNVVFEYNTCLDAGRGWGQPQRPIPNGRHVMLFYSYATVTNCAIQNNIFQEATHSCVKWWLPSQRGLVLVDNNCYYQSAGNIATFGTTNFNSSEFGLYQAYSKQDAHSFVADAQLLSDFRLKDSSPCIDRAAISDRAPMPDTDFSGVARPQDGNDDGEAMPDIGGYEYVNTEYGALNTNAYSKKLDVRFSGYTGSALTNFPVLVKLSTAIEGFSYSDFAMPNGGDLRFADVAGNLIPHEIDTWKTNGVSTVWVKVPRLASSAKVTACYGCTGEPAAVDAKDVWDKDYVGVWHLGESALPMKESSETSSDFATQSGTGIGYAAAGAVGGSVDFGAPGNGRMLDAADHNALDGFETCTFEAWTFITNRPTSGDPNTGLLSKRTAYGQNVSYYIYDTGAVSAFNVSSNGTSQTGCGWLTPTVGAWTHQVMTFDAGSMKGYRDGLQTTTAFCAVRKINSGSSSLHLGNFNAGDARNYPGRIDELRFSRVVRSADWIRATHDTVMKSDFARYGDQSGPDPTSVMDDLKLKARTDKDNPIGYTEGENIRFDFFLDGVESLPVEAVEPLYVIWERTADDGVMVKGTNTISLAQGFSINTSLAIPGIVRIEAYLAGPDYMKIMYTTAAGPSASVNFSGGAGVSTEKMQLSAAEPADFDSFWADAKAKLAAVPIRADLTDVTETCLPPSATNLYHVYAASVDCYGPRPVTGWLTLPRNAAAGSLPAIVTFDGYSAKVTKPTPPTSGSGLRIRFNVNAHGYNMLENDQYYADFTSTVTSPAGRKTYALEPSDYANPTNTYLYFMALRIVRACDYLKSLPEWNGTVLIASGGSQGGLQTMWAASLVVGLSEAQPGITWGCDLGNSLSSGPLLSNTWGIPNVSGAYYFDAAVHAKRIPTTCSVNITRIGMGDYTCPPRGVLLSYYNMRCPVSATLVQGSTHGYVPPEPNQKFVISKAAVEEEPLGYDMDDDYPLPGYDAWMSSRALQGAPEVVSANGIPNGIRYAFNLDPALGPTEIGEPIIRVVTDANGNPCVRFREVVNPEGVALDVLATERLDTWGESFLIDMEPFADGLWKPSASKDQSYTFPPQMFFKYLIDVSHGD